MLQLTKKVDYAILIATSICAKKGEPVSANEISQQYGLSRPFIANIMKRMAKERLLKSERGVNGGYILNRPPEEITLNDIVTTLDGPFQLTECTAGLVEGPDGEITMESCSQESMCTALGPIRNIHRKIQEMLDTVTVSEMAGEKSGCASSAAAEETAV